MKKLTGLLILLACAGCADKDDTKAGITAFAKQCESTLQAKMVLGQWGNKLELSCDSMKKE